MASDAPYQPSLFAAAAPSFDPAFAATNVFVLEDGSWRIVHHHAVPLASPISKPASQSAAN